MRSAASEPRRARPPPAPVTGDWRRGRGSEGRGTNQRHTKPELKPGLSSLFQMGQQLRCRRAAGIIGAGGQQLSGGSPVPREEERGRSPLRASLCSDLLLAFCVVSSPPRMTSLSRQR